MKFCEVHNIPLRQSNCQFASQFRFRSSLPYFITMFRLLNQRTYII